MAKKSEPGLPNRLVEILNEHDLTMEEVAERIGVHWTTISRLANGRVPMTDRWMMKLAAAIGLSDPVEILRKPGQSFAVPVKGIVGAGAEIIPFDDGMDRIDEVDVAAFVPDGVAALIVRGDSMYPVYEDQDTIFYRDTGQLPRDLVGREVVVRLDDGRTFVKRLRRGSSPIRFSLESYNSPTIEDVIVEWAAPTWDPVRDAARFRRF